MEKENQNPKSKSKSKSKSKNTKLKFKYNDEFPDIFDNQNIEDGLKISNKKLSPSPFRSKRSKSIIVLKPVEEDMEFKPSQSLFKLNITSKNRDVSKCKTNIDWNNSNLVKFYSNCLKNDTVEIADNLRKQEEIWREELWQHLTHLNNLNKEIEKESIEYEAKVIHNHEMINYMSEWDAEKNADYSKLNTYLNKLNQYNCEMKMILSGTSSRDNLEKKTKNINQQITAMTQEMRDTENENKYIVSVIEQCSQTKEIEDKNIATHDEEIKLRSRTWDAMTVKLNNQLNKITESNKVRIEWMSYILTGKPNYKKIIFLRPGSPQEQNKKQIPTTPQIPVNAKYNSMQNKQFTLNKNRKSILFSNFTEYKFDYILSTISNPYEEREKLGNAPQFYQDECVNILLPYISKLTSVMEKNNFFVLYLTKTPSFTGINPFIIDVLNEIKTHFTELEWTVEVVLKKTKIMLTEPDNKGVIGSQIKKINEKLYGISYTLQNKNTFSKCEIINIDYKTSGISTWLGKLNDFNHFKKKKPKTQNQKLTSTVSKRTKLFNINLYLGIDCSVIMDLINVVNPFHLLTILDITTDELFTNEIKIMFNAMNSKNK